MAGLYFGYHSSWSEVWPECEQYLRLNQTELDDLALPPTNLTVVIWQGIPKVNGQYVAHFCSLNQRWMNLCVKAFVTLFSYVNFLPIPWRLAILHHVWCSSRCSDAGLDFYGRPTGSLWFHIPKESEQPTLTGCRHRLDRHLPF